jgi:hypothetical protein
MTASTYIGRVGGLAMALGVGAAIFSGAGTAWAGPDSTASPGPTASDSGDGGAGGGVAHDVGNAIRKAVKDTMSNVAEVGAHVRELGNDGRSNLHALADNLGAHLTTATTRPHVASGADKPVLKTPLNLASTLPTFGAPGRHRVVEDVSSGTVQGSLPETLSPQDSLHSIAAPFRSLIDVGLTTDTAANPVVAVFNQIVRPFAGTAPIAPPPAVPLTGLTDLVQLAGLRRGLSGAASTLDQPSASQPAPTLVLNGYEIYSTSPEKVVSWYGFFTTPPGTPGTLQGVQDFKVIDPESGKEVGTFTALVNNTNAFFVGGGTFQEYVVTESDGAGAPPVGTLISQNKFGYFGAFGIQYTSTPIGTTGERDTSFKLLTPFGDVHVPWPRDPAVVLTSVSTPMKLGDGYYIAPEPTSPEEGIGISGVPPFFAVYQGKQVFNVYDPDGNVVGTFEGYTATTEDLSGLQTQAILVTKVTYVSAEGTASGKVPTGGSIYNIYHYHGVDILYSAVPDPSDGPTDITFKIQLPGNLPDIDIPFFWDATKVPTMNSLEVPGKYTLVPSTDLQPIGVNGLPPREVQVQGYQQFDVYDKAGNKIGTVDADVTNQYSLDGTVINSVLVTKVTPADGVDAADLPPVGTQYSSVTYPVGGVGILYASTPSATDPKGKNVWSLLTPLGNVNVPFPFYNPVKGLDDVTYVDPF